MRSNSQNQDDYGHASGGDGVVEGRKLTDQGCVWGVVLATRTLLPPSSPVDVRLFWPNFVFLQAPVTLVKMSSKDGLAKLVPLFV